MRTDEQNSNLRALMDHINEPGTEVGPSFNRRPGHEHFCAKNQVYWINKNSTVSRAQCLAYEDNTKLYGTPVLFGLLGRRPDGARIMREYYGLTPAEVERINHADRRPLPYDEYWGRRLWISSMTSLLTSLIDSQEEVLHEEILHEVIPRAVVTRHLPPFVVATLDNQKEDQVSVAVERDITIT